MTVLTKQDPIKLVQITDTHLYGTKIGTLLRMNTRDSLRHVIRLVKENEKEIDFILATGDITQDASLKAYKNFIHVISELNAPFRWIPGNHDIASVMAKAEGDTGACGKVVQINNWQILFLDSSIEGQVHGRLAKSETDFLEATLAAAQQNDSIDHCMICLHHNPVKGNADWMKDIGLDNGPQLFKILKAHDKAKYVVYGHVHQDLDFEKGGIRCLCTPSTCIQFKPDVANFALDDVNPGYRSIKLFEDGTIETEVHRVTGPTLEADYSSEGY